MYDGLSCPEQLIKKQLYTTYLNISDCVLNVKFVTITDLLDLKNSVVQLSCQASGFLRESDIKDTKSFLCLLLLLTATSLMRTGPLLSHSPSGWINGSNSHTCSSNMPSAEGRLFL